MLIKNTQKLCRPTIGFLTSILIAAASTTEIRTQGVRSVPPAPPAASTEDFTWWYILLFVLTLALAGAIWWWRSNKQAQNNGAVSKTKSSMRSGSDSSAGALDADKELEWLRKNRKTVGQRNRDGATPRTRPSNLSQPNSSPQNEENENNAGGGNASNEPVLPIFSIERVELSKPFDALPISNDEDLMTAIDQGYDEFEEDEEVRELAVRILAAFRKRNSVEALSQVALYDLSAGLRSKAVTTLSEFDHESVFETILLANADPTREVRAAAARGLTKLTFDRADAWTRIAETGEDGRIGQSARAAMESGFVDMSFDRLASRDSKQAYEAFALMALLIKAGETEKILNMLENHREMNVRRAILHVIKVTKDQKALDGLCALLEKNTLPIEFQEEVDKTIEEVGFVVA